MSDYLPREKVHHLAAIAARRGRPLFLFDLQTSSYFGQLNFGITEISALKIWPDGANQLFFHTVDPQNPVDPDIAAQNGVTDEYIEQRVKEGKAFPWPAYAKGLSKGFCEALVVGFHAVQHDIRAVIHQNLRYSVSGEEFPILDFQHVMRCDPASNIQDEAQKLGICPVFEEGLAASTRDLLTLVYVAEEYMLLNGVKPLLDNQFIVPSMKVRESVQDFIAGRLGSGENRPKINQKATPEGEPTAQSKENKWHRGAANLGERSDGERTGFKQARLGDVEKEQAVLGFVLAQCKEKGGSVQLSESAVAMALQLSLKDVSFAIGNLVSAGKVSTQTFKNPTVVSWIAERLPQAREEAGSDHLKGIISVLQRKNPPPGMDYLQLRIAIMEQKTVNVSPEMR